MHKRWTTGAVMVVGLGVFATAAVSTTPAAALIFDSATLLKFYNNHNEFKILPGRAKRPHTVLGRVKVSLEKESTMYVQVGVSHLLSALRDKAKAMGANGVVQYRYSKSPVTLFSWGMMTGEGVAIKYHGKPPGASKSKRASSKKRRQSEQRLDR